MGISLWQKKPLKELCYRIGDGIHGTPEYSTDSNIPFINGNNLKNGKIHITENTRFVTYEEFESQKIKLNSNSLLLSINGTLGSLAFYDEEQIMLGKSAAYLNFKTDINKFQYYYFQLKDVQNYFYNVATGSTIKNLSLKSIQDFEVPVPDELTYQQIAKVLSDLDAKIAINNKINQQLEALAKTLYDYWFVQFDFPFDFAQGKPSNVSSSAVENSSATTKPYKSSGGKMFYNEELKREIPDGWEVKDLNSLVKCNYDSLSSSEDDLEINYLDTSSLTLNEIGDLQRINSNNDKIPSRAKRIVNKNDILYSTVRPNLCHYGIIKDPIDSMIASTGFAQISSTSELISNDLIYTFITSNWVTTYLSQIAALSVSAYPSISHKDILALKIPIPKNENILENINSKLNSFYTKISLNQKQNHKLVELRDWLLPMLMNGQVQVNSSDAGVVAGGLGMVAESGVEYKKGK